MNKNNNIFKINFYLKFFKKIRQKIIKIKILNKINLSKNIMTTNTRK